MPNNMKTQLWEDVPQDHAGTMSRMRVPGGWLVKIVDDVNIYMGRDQAHPQGGYEWRTTMAFVPDPEYRWLPKEEVKE